ncbi:MAG: T9SS type A sorting domain-containing protein, partial [Flavobacteriales bacterium]|nr:T9SS type A sorting domain-containing protein [Flavobacteriales bacterium]
DLEWTKTYGGTVTDEAYDVWQNEDSGYIVAGSVRSFLPDNDGVLMRLNASGEIIWSESIGGVDSDGIFSVQQTLDGGFVAAGVTALGLNFDFLLVKVDENGAETWTKQIGGGGDNYCYQVKQAEDGGYAMSGYYVVPFEGANGYLVRTDSAGDTLWTRTYGGPGDDQMKGFTFTDDGGYMLSGHTTSFGSGNGDFYNVKTNANGESNCDEFNPDVELIEANVDYEVWDPEEGSGGDVSELIAIVGGGGFTQTNCTSVDLEDAVATDQDIRIFPNPAHDIINVQSAQWTDDFSWRIINLYGQVVATGIFPSGQGTIDISNISDGQYVLEYQHAHVMVEVMK